MRENVSKSSCVGVGVGTEVGMSTCVGVGVKGDSVFTSSDAYQMLHSPNHPNLHL